MWNGKKKAITFSFDDGVTQDIRLIEILNEYGLKGTFNLNSGFLGNEWSLNRNGVDVRHDKVKPEEVSKIYAGHEVAVHTCTHPNLTTLSEEEIVKQVEEDRLALEKLVGYPIRGMAYPCGGVNNDDRVAEILGRRTPIRYSRTITSSHSFAKQDNLLRFNPTVYYIEKDKMNALADKFLNAEGEEDMLFYIWGHSYEMDANYISWEEFEKFCKKIAGKADVFYGTNTQTLL